MRGRAPVGNGRIVQPRETGGGPLSRECPDCGVGIGMRCFDLRSWVGPPPLVGFYSRRRQSFHPGRKLAPASMASAEVAIKATTTGTVTDYGHNDRAEPPTNEQRGRAFALIDAKLTQNRKGPARQFLYKPGRTAADVIRFIERLEAMPDVVR